MNLTINRLHDRRGVTLLFVVSMIVLFLLMGTTFVVVSNDFMSASIQRNRVRVQDIRGLGEIPGQRFLNQALFDLIRGPALNNSNSPLRGHSILADMYGYGFASYVRDVEIINAAAGGTEQQFFRIRLMGANVNIHENRVQRGNLQTTNIGNDLLSGDAISFANLGDAPGRLNGQLLSFVSGAFTGVTARIIDHQVFMGSDHRFVIVLINEPETYQVSTADNLIDAFDTTANPDLPTRVIINGRPFTGTGAGAFDIGHGNRSALDAAAHLPNRQGESLDDLQNGYMRVFDNDGASFSATNSIATNEPYDAPDPQNMFLAGFDATGTFIPSFHRGGLGAGTQTSFWPEIPDTVGAVNATATAEFGQQNGYYVENTTTLIPFGMRSPSVRHDSDGNPDGIWMDIGLPNFTTENGVTVKPLVSYLVADLDGKINVSVHGNRSQIATNNNFSVAADQVQFHSATQPQGAASMLVNQLRGGGYGPAEVNLGTVFNNAGEAERLMLGIFDDPDPTAITNASVPGRYGFDIVGAGMGRRRSAGGGPVPGLPASTASDGSDPFALYKSFGSPYVLDVATSGPGVLGRHYMSSPMDILGRFRTDFPQIYDTNVGTFPIGIPTVDVGTSTLAFSEIANSPYEVDFLSPGQQLGIRSDQLYTLEELEYVYRRGDTDLIGSPNTRLYDMAPMTFDNTPTIATTESWEVPTTFGEFLGDVDGTGTLTGVRYETLTTKLYRILNFEGGGNVGIGGMSSPMKEQEIMANISGFVPQSTGDYTLDGSGGFGGGINMTPRGMLSVDVREGRPFNINQPFGDGLDTNGNLLVDDDGENDVLNPSRRSHPRI